MCIPTWGACFKTQGRNWRQIRKPRTWESCSGGINPQNWFHCNIWKRLFFSFQKWTIEQKQKSGLRKTPWRTKISRQNRETDCRNFSQEEQIFAWLKTSPTWFCPKMKCFHQSLYILCFVYVQGRNLTEVGCSTTFIMQMILVLRHVQNLHNKHRKKERNLDPAVRLVSQWYPCKV